MAEIRFRCLFFFLVFVGTCWNQPKNMMPTIGMLVHLCVCARWSDVFFLQPYSCVNRNTIVQWVLFYRISNAFPSKTNITATCWKIVRYESNQLFSPSCVHEKHMWHCGFNWCILIWHIAIILRFLHFCILYHFVGIVSRLNDFSRIVTGRYLQIRDSHPWIARCADCQDPKMRNARTLGRLNWMWGERR